MCQGCSGSLRVAVVFVLFFEHIHIRQMRWRVQRVLESGLGLGLGFEEVFVFDSKSENRD